MRLALLTTRLFDAPRSGGEICTARLVDALRAGGHEIVRVGRGPGGTGVGDLTLGPLAPAFDELPWSRRLASVGAALAAGQACTVHRLAAGALPERAARTLADLALGGAEAVIVDHLQAFAWLRRGPPNLPLLLVMHNAESDDYARRADVAGTGLQGRLQGLVLRREARHLRALEAEALAAAGAVACLSDEDARRLRRRLPHDAPVPVEVLPGFPTAPPVPPAAPEPDGSRRIGLIGTWTWGPNRDALRWMLETVLPQLPPHCRLVLAGSGLQGLPPHPRVLNLGRVESARQLHTAVDVLAVPSLHGTGVQEKAIEAIGTGRPVVASGHALRGLGPLPPQVQVADSAADFARACAQPAPAGPGAEAGRAAWAAARRARHAAALERCLRALQ